MCFTTHNTRHTTHHTHTHITGNRVDTKRRRRQRQFRDHSAHGFRRVFRATKVGHITAHRARHPSFSVDASHPFFVPPFPPPHPHHTHNTRHTTHHTHTSQVLGWTPSDECTNDYSATIMPYVSPCVSGHTTQDTPHTTHTHTSHVLG